MNFEQILDPKRPIPWQLHERSNLRQVVGIILVLHHRALAFIQPTHDETGNVWIPPQGGCEEGENIFEAARRETREELPSLRRPHRTDNYRVEWNQGQYLGSAENHLARSGRPNQSHWVAFPAVYEGLRVDPAECRSAQWVYDPDYAVALLEITRETNPTKSNIISSAIGRVMELQMLS